MPYPSELDDRTGRILHCPIVDLARGGDVLDGKSE
jgi:hypothetical protein